VSKPKAGKAASPPPRAQNLTRAEKHAILISVTCRLCGAAEGASCTTPSGNSVAQTHQARYEDAGKYGRNLIQW
jgi:hypothetical protein